MSNGTVVSWHIDFEPEDNASPKEAAERSLGYIIARGSQARTFTVDADDGFHEVNLNDDGEVSVLPKDRVYTVFCVDCDHPTTWIDTVSVPHGTSLVKIKMLACEAAAKDWDTDPSSVRCTGVALGDLTLLHWDDEPDFS